MKIKNILIISFAVFFAARGLSKEGEPRNVAIFLYQQVEILDFSGPAEVFAATMVNGAHAFNVYTVAATAEPIVSQGFIDVTPDYTIHNCPKPDIIVLPGGNSGTPMQDENVLNWIKNSWPDLDVAMSVCTGAFLLAKVGLLDGLPATTWHGAIERLREFAPKTKVMENTRFVDTGNIVTTAGVSAGIDGALHVVSRLHGEDVARKTARYMEYDKWDPNAGFINRTEQARK
jgi:transcriptional regulator GlxA family with amidase domain